MQSDQFLTPSDMGVEVVFAAAEHLILHTPRGKSFDFF